ncbi:MAG: T9SS type A sorting domain-containing protein, partial [Sphingobacteriales bacterium]
PELAAWAGDYGFAVDELAWIQPTYGPLPSRHGKGLGKGTNGEIYELFVTSNNPRLFVGGDFTMADSTVSANHIAYVLESNGNYSWHSMGTGVNGPVNAIAEFNNKIFVAGEFTEAGGSPASNIAYWDGANWFDAGCISGVVNDLVVFSGELYAAGDFDVCTGMAEVNFAKWNGGVWQPIPGISGFVNTMEVVDTFIYLGGSFGLGLNPENVARWSSNSGFEIFPNMIENEVRDFEIFKDTVFASCRRTSAMDSNLVVKLVGGSWQPYNAMAPYVYSSLVHIQFQPSFNTLLTQADTLILGGSFINSAMMSGPDIQNNVNLYSPGGVVNWFVVDDAINKMVIFKNELIFAGKFKTAFNYLSGHDTLNHIGRKTYPFLNSIPQLPGNDAVARIYPNPVSGNDITVENNFGATSYVVTDMSGRLLASGDMQEEKENIKLPALSAGNYMVTLTNGEVKKTERLVIR